MNQPGYRRSFFSVRGDDELQLVHFAIQAVAKAVRLKAYRMKKCYE
jgi:hypothetical protein